MRQMDDYELERLLVQVRRIEEHREKGAELEIRKTYQQLLQELRYYMADEYSQYAENDQLTYDILQRNSSYARFLEEVEQKINDISPEIKRLIRSTVEQTYEYTYNGMIDCVRRAAPGVELGSLKACTPEVLRRAVENPISKLSLNDRLEKHRKEIIYDIKQNISVGLVNGDRYSTMANRIKQSVEGDYKKAIRIARTETHRVREAGNHDAARAVDEVLKTGESGMRMTKIWKTMKDERVRPAHRYKTKKGWKNGKPGKYDHKRMEGVEILVDDEFTLPSGAKTTAPGQSGVAGEDINCRCRLSYGLKKMEQSDTIKEIKIPKEVYDTQNITPDIVEGIQEGISEIEQEYQVKLNRFLVEDVSGRLPNTPYFVRYIDNDGMREVEFVINAGYDFTDFENIVKNGYELGYFAGKSVKDHAIHEMVHAMTGQQYMTTTAFNDFAKRIEKQYIPGVSGYSDDAKDGFETLAEAFVRMRNKEPVPEEAEKLVRKYIERWRKE